MAKQTRTAKHVGLRGSVRGQWITNGYIAPVRFKTWLRTLQMLHGASIHISTHQYVRIELEMKTTMHAAKSKLRWWILEE
ncbi:BnaA09g24530D [Brassica napus]|uniref:BnaA09g24530D protein n=1 Tax=Brassica napus TaxID=3708 RepID=A0A078FJG5_BRANA|nr:BnaA09g24530D [Brassica napus]